MRRSLRALDFPLRSGSFSSTSGTKNVVCHTSSVHQESHITKDGVCESPSMLTPHPPARLSLRVAVIDLVLDLRKTFEKMTSKYTAPKRKEEYVAAISSRTGLACEELRKHHVGRLKQIWTMVKPKKPQSPLPVGWEKADVTSLRER